MKYLLVLVLLVVWDEAWLNVVTFAVKVIVVQVYLSWFRTRRTKYHGVHFNVEVAPKARD
jgi:hypothetical protein